MSRRHLQVLALTLLVMGLTRWPTRSREPFNWDAVNFSLAVDRFDPAQHQPHPPPAVGFVVAGRLLRAATGDAHAALVLWNVAMAAAAAFLAFAFAHAAAPQDKERHGWLAWAAGVGSVQAWFYADVAEIYMSEMAAGLLVAFCCLRLLQGAPQYLFATGAALAICGMFRLTGMVFLAPLCAWAVATSPVARHWRALLAFVLVTALWVVPLLLWTGPSAYFDALLGQYRSAAQPTSFLSGGLRALNRNARDVAYTLIAGVGLFNVVALPVFVVATRPRLRPTRRSCVLALLWFVPAASFFVLVHMGKYGYTLLLAPVLWMACAFLYAQARRSLVTGVLIAGQILGGASHFLLGRRAEGESIGDGLRYRDKTFAQKFVTEFNGLLFATRATIERADRDTALVVHLVRASGCDTPVLFAVGGEGFSWRKAMYHLPEALSVRLPELGSAFMRGRNRRFEVSQDPSLRVVTDCRALWILPPDHPALRALRATGPVTSPAPWVHWTEGPRKVALDPYNVELVTPSRPVFRTSATRTNRRFHRRRRLRRRPTQPRRPACESAGGATPEPHETHPTSSTSPCRR